MEAGKRLEANATQKMFTNGHTHTESVYHHKPSGKCELKVQCDTHLQKGIK